MPPDFENEEMEGMDQTEPEQEEAVEDFSAGYDDYAEPKKLFSKNFLIYGIALLWSFFIVFIFMYYLMYNRQQKTFEIFHKQEEMIADTTTTIDSLVSVGDKLGESGESFAKDDSGRGFYVPPEGFLTMEDHMRILKLENGRRKREIDFLWDELRTLKDQTSDLEKLERQVDSLKTVEPKTIVIKDTTPSFEAIQQQELLEQKKEEERLARLAAEKQQQEAAIAKSAKIYSSMKPKEAASILASFDSKTAAQMLMKIRERQAAKILEAMEPQQAIKISKYMIQ